MQRISIDKKDGVPKIVEKILESPDSELLLIIPAKSALKDSEANFQLLKREAEAAEKHISIESIDKEVLALARKAKIEAIHPLFRDDVGARSLSDIIPLETSRNQAKQPEVLPEKQERRKKETSAYEASKKMVEAEPEEEVRQASEEGDRGLFSPESEQRRTRPRWVKVVAVVLIAALVAVGGGWALGQAFGKAEVTISFKKTPWQYQDSFSASKAFAKINVDARTLPAEAFFQNKNGTWLFPASGRAQVSQKATGKIIIYNAYSASPQTLVAATRVMTPDGKMFRLDAKVVVPGAGVKNGIIAPSSIQADITADKAGEDYNISSTDHLTIPGFKGTPRYKGFYGVLSGPASGGSVGEKQIPTDKDIAAAKDKASQNLRDGLQVAFLNNRPDGFKILDGASQIQITKLTVGKVADQNGNFTVFGEAQFKAVGFKESDFKTLLQTLAAKDYPGTTFRDLQVNYANVKANFDAGQLSFSVTAQGVLGPVFSADDFKSKIVGHPISEARQTILALPDLSSAKISLLPFWLYKLPANTQKVKVVAD